MAEAATSMTWSGLLRAVGQWFRHNLPAAIIMSAISFGFAWLVNFVIMAFRWDGFRAPTLGGSDYIAAENSLIAGSLFWVGITSLLFALASYGYRVGWQQLIEDVMRLPTTLRQMFQGEERNRSLTTLAWAGMLSMLLGLVISPAVAGIAAGFFIVFATTPLGALLTGAVRRLWMQLVVRFAPHKGEPTSEVGAAAVSAAGMVAGFAVAAVLDSLVLGVIALILFGLAAYYFANEDELGAGTGTAVFLLIAAAVGLYELFEAGVGIAFADDGGWSECGDCNIIDYVTSTGATEVVSRSTVAAGGAGVGAPIGAAVGDVLGTTGGGGGGGGGPAGGGGGAGGDTPADDAAQPAADDGDPILGAIGGGEDGTLAPAPEAGAGGGGGGGGAPSAPPAAGTGDTPPGAAAPGGPGATGSEAAPEEAPAEGDAPTESDADAILGAIGGGEDGVLPPAGGDEPLTGGAEEAAGAAAAGVGATDTAPTRRDDGPAQDMPDDDTEGGASDQMPPPEAPTEDMPPPTAPTEDMPPPTPPVVPPEPPPAPGDVPPAPEEPPPPTPAPADDDTAPAPAGADEQPSTGVWGRDLSGWLNDAATRLGEAKDTLEGWIDDHWGEDEAAGVKETLQTERIGENLESVVEATDTYNHFHDMAGETIDDLNRLGIDENGQNAVTWLRVVAEGAGRATQTFVDGIVTPVMEAVVAPFGGDAEQITHTLLPVQETAEEFSQAIHNGARNIRGGDNYAGQMAENQDLDLEALWRFP